MLRRIIKVGIEDSIVQMTTAVDTYLQFEMRGFAAVERFRTRSSVADRQCARIDHVIKGCLAFRYKSTGRRCCKATSLSSDLDDANEHGRVRASGRGRRALSAQ